MTEPRPSRYWPSCLAGFISWPCALWFTGCSCLFFLIAADVRYHGSIARWDQQFTTYLHSLETHKILFFSWVTEFGTGGAQKLLWALTLPLAFSKCWYQVPGLFLAVFLGGDINSKMQHFFGRHRPTFDDLPLLTHPGFPSGHTANACLFFGYAALILWVEFGSTKLFKASVAVISSAVILSVAASRAALLVHYTSDVIGSLLWCTAWIIVCYSVNRAALQASAQRMNIWLKGGCNST